MDKFTVYTDGCCKGNPGKGGWGCVIIRNLEPIESIATPITEIYGGEPDTTNNRMELTAAVKGLSLVQSLSDLARVTIYTDSKYVKDGITQWIDNWKTNGWRTAKKEPVKNADLWMQLDRLDNAIGLVVEWKWVKGHAGDKYNEKCDELANLGVDNVKS